MGKGCRSRLRRRAPTWPPSKTPRGLITRLTYDPSGLATNVADPFGRNASFEYDANQNLVQSVDMGGYWTSYAYDDNVYLTAII